jgi:phage baseplate assembly protein W
MNMRKFKGFSTVGKTWGNFTLYDVNLAKQNILNEFYTRKGERVMSPAFGSIVWDLLFDPLTDDTVQLIKDDSQRIVTKDPRLELQDIRVEEEEHTIRVIILLNYIPSATLTELVATFNRDIATSIQQG